MLQTRTKPPACIIASVGGSGAGKTTLCPSLKQILGENNALRLSQDNFFKDVPRVGKPEDMDFDQPDWIKFSELKKCLFELKEQRSTSCPIYDFEKGESIANAEFLEARPVVIVEGTLVLHDPELRDNVDFSIYLDLEKEERLERRLKRDSGYNSYNSGEDIKKRFERFVQPAHLQYVEKQKELVSCVFDAEKSPEVNAQIAIEKIRELKLDLA